MNFVGNAKKIDDIDLPRIGEMIGVGEDELHAVLDVETRGGGFDSMGRPKMLFEPHIFYRQLKGKQRTQAVNAGLAYKSWGESRYPRDSYPRLKEAMKINSEAALNSASWGLGQIMGFNASVCGYGSAKAMVEDFLDDEENHLEAMVNFIIANSLDDELRRHDWAGFARGYNGPAYKKNKYDVKLRNAFAKWQKIPDTPFEIDRAEVELNEAEIPQKTVSVEVIAEPEPQVGPEEVAAIRDLVVESDSDNSSTLERALLTKIRSMLTGGGATGALGYLAGAWDKFASLPVTTQLMAFAVIVVIMAVAYYEYKGAVRNEQSRNRKGNKADIARMALAKMERAV